MIPAEYKEKIERCFDNAPRPCVGHRIAFSVLSNAGAFEGMYRGRCSECGGVVIVGSPESVDRANKEQRAIAERNQPAQPDQSGDIE